MQDPKTIADQLVIDALGPTWTDSRLALADLIAEALRSYGAACAAEMKERCANIAMWRRSDANKVAARSAEADYIARLIRALD